MVKADSVMSIISEERIETWFQPISDCFNR